MTVRQATPMDLDALVPLFDGYRQFYHQPADPTAARAFLHARLTQGDSVILIAQPGEHATGFTQLYPSFSSVRMVRTYILNDLFVLPHARGTGTARALLAAACDYGRDAGAASLSLSTGVDNLTAQSLYESAGWVRDTGFYSYGIALG